MDQPAAAVAERKAWGRSLATLAFLVGVSVAALLSVQPPSSDQSASGFSTEAAMQRLKVIAREPRPMGSQANRAVRDYLVKQFEELGLEVDQQVATYTNETDGATWQITNVLARVRGIGDGTAVLLMAHYDTVPEAPGAGDDGAAVAALLEVARAVKADPPMRNDVVFLLTDGEEYGLLGARAFVREHGWFKDIGLALNFEGRGSSGPSIMFQTSPNNGWLIEQFADANVHPVTSSLAYEVFSLMPTSSDFVILKRAGVAGFDFAFLGSPQNYHSVTDNLANLDPRSLRHHGVQALALARHFGNLDLTNLPHRDDVVFFSLPWIGVIYYETGWALALAVLAAITLVAAISYGLHRKQLKLRRIAIAFGVGLINAIVVSVAVYLMWKLLESTNVWNHPDLTFLGFVFLAVALTLALIITSSRHLGIVDMAAGLLMWWSLLAVVSAVWVPAASYIFTWPLLSSSTSLIMLMHAREPLRLPALPLSVQCLAAIPGIFLLVPAAGQASSAMGLQDAYALVLVIVLLLWTLAPQLQTLVTPSRWLLPTATVFVAATCLSTSALWAMTGE